MLHPKGDSPSVTQALIDDAKRHFGGTPDKPLSDYRLAQLLGITKQRVHIWTSGKSAISDAMAVKVAQRIGRDPITLLLDLHLESERDRITAESWAKARQRLTHCH